MRKGLVLALAAVVSASAAAPAGGSGDTLRLTTVVHGSFAEQGGGPAVYAYAVVGNRITDVTGLLYQTSKTDQARAESVDYRKSFSVLVKLGRPTTGFTISLERVIVLHARRQACAIVAIRKPPAGRAVYRRQTTYYHLVKVPRDSLGPVVADRIVLHDTVGHLLYSERYPNTAQAGLCR